MITTLYAGILGLLYFKISLDTISARRNNRIALGTGPAQEISYIVSAHSNFSAYTPYFLVFMYLGEVQLKLPTLFLHLLAIVFVLGRIVHYLTMKNEEKTFKQRKLGMMLTLWPFIILASSSVILALKEMLIG